MPPGLKAFGGSKTADNKRYPAKGFLRRILTGICLLSLMTEDLLFCRGDIHREKPVCNPGRHFAGPCICFHPFRHYKITGYRPARFIYISSRGTPPRDFLLTRITPEYITGDKDHMDTPVILFSAA